MDYATDPTELRGTRNNHWQHCRYSMLFLLSAAPVAHNMGRLVDDIAVAYGSSFPALKLSHVPWHCPETKEKVIIWTRKKSMIKNTKAQEVIATWSFQKNTDQSMIGEKNKLPLRPQIFSWLQCVARRTLQQLGGFVEVSDEQWKKGPWLG